LKHLHKGYIEKKFERHINENELQLHKVCRVYADTEADRQDLFQEIIIQLWRSYPNFKGNAKFSTWLYRIAINTAITGLRKKKDLIQYVEPSQLPIQAAHDPDEIEERSAELYRAINSLNDIDKAIVLLYLEEKTYEEMEDILGITQGNLRVKMNRIKDKLRQLTKNN
jgi:RNA polymerase sigma factor (sigma-70 family)